MTELQCDVRNCANNQNNWCCRPDIMVGGPRASAGSQTYCANFIDQKSGSATNAVDSKSPNPNMDIHCEVAQCSYNDSRACIAEHIDIRTTRVNAGQVKTECATFENKQ